MPGRLLTLLLCLLAMGFVATAQAGFFTADQSDHACMQSMGSGGDCGHDGLGASACTAHCAATACVVPAYRATLLAISGVRPCAGEAVMLGDRGSAPDTAPPKAPLP